MIYAKEKKQTLIMINGWRASPENAGRLKLIELKVTERDGGDFVKAKLMDDIFKRGLDSWEVENG